MGKRVALIAGVGVLAVLILALILRERLWRGYLERHWNRIDIIAVDNCDPDFKSAGPRGGGIQFLDEQGEQLFYLGGLNNCETVGAHHGIALDGERFRIYLRELVSRRITALDATGGLLFRIEPVEADALALDPGTGNLWCVGERSLDQGEVQVFDPGGKRAGTYPIRGHDIAYSPHDQTFWVVGYDVVKCDRDGRLLVNLPKSGWAKVSVAPDPRDGSAWVAERDHPDVKDSRNRLLRLDPHGQVTRELELDTQDPFCVACDPDTGMAWVVEYGKSVLRVPVDGPPLPPIPIPAVAIAIGSARKHRLWVSTKDALHRLDPDGRTMVTSKLSQASSQSWITAP